MTAKDTIKYSSWDAWGEGGQEIDHLSPEDVICDAGLSQAEKRAILADWASDARAVELLPGFRRIDNGVLVWLDDIQAALRRLDNDNGDSWRATNMLVSRHVRPRIADLLKGRRHGRSDGDNDDDDPPPSPAFVLSPKGGDGGGGLPPAACAMALPDALQAA